MLHLASLFNGRRQGTCHSAEAPTHSFNGCQFNIAGGVG